MKHSNKKLIAITQRVDIHSLYSERRDALDQRWIEILSQLGFCALPLPNHATTAKSLIQTMKPDGIILSGGNSVDKLAINNAPERDQTETVCLEHAEKMQLPVLGVCRGFQYINCFLGGSVGPIDGHVGHTHTVINARSELELVNSFHGDGIMRGQLAPKLRETSVANDGSIESAMHVSLPWLGVMWHPERPIADTNPNPSELGRLLENIGLKGAPGYA